MTVRDLETSTAGERSAPDRLVDELVPESVDWERLVRRYPLPALLLAAAGGFLLGRSRGSEIVAALSAFAGRRVTESVNALLGEEVLD